MPRLVIFGNSGSGKSTLARKRAAADNLAHLDLDTLAWEPVSPPERAAPEKSAAAISAFTDANEHWVIEGCYADLIALVLPDCTELIFLDLPVTDCIENAKRRPWEPHKYASPEAQDANLAMLLDWIAQYPERDDTFSRRAHTALYDDFSGAKIRYTNNDHKA